MTEKLIITVAPTGSMPKKATHLMFRSIRMKSWPMHCCARKQAHRFCIFTPEMKQNPSDDPDRFSQVVHALTGRTKLILQISTGGRAGVTLESRRARSAAGGEMASLTTGSVNFPNSAYVNPPDLVEGLAAEMTRLSMKPEIEVFDLAMLHNGITLMERGLIAQPLHFNFVKMGLQGAMPARVNILFTWWAFFLRGRRGA